MKMMKRCSFKLIRRRGLSLVEVLVCLSVIGLLLALLLPAVQASREAARRVNCLSKVKQIALGVANYENSFGYYPASGGLDQPSFIVRILPQIDQGPLFYRFDLDGSMAGQSALARQRPELLFCPSDSAAANNKLLRSYGGNVGWYEPFASNSATDVALTGVITYATYRPIGTRDVLDGLSNTAMVSEMSSTGYIAQLQMRWDERATGGRPFGRDPGLMASDCLDATSHYQSSNSASWIFGGFVVTLYDHILPPNSRRCNWVTPSIGSHSGGNVSTAFCDGSARQINNTIDVDVWRAIGTRRGGEVVSFAY